MPDSEKKSTKNKRAPTFQSSPEFDESTLDEQYQLDSWTSIVIKAIVYTLIIIVLNYLVGFGYSIIIGRNAVRYIYTLAAFFEVSILWLIGGVQIWFGPSPSFAKIIAYITGGDANPKSTDLALRQGLQKFFIGFLLIFTI